MNVTQITAMRRRPLEQYGHIEITMTASLEEGANPFNCAIQLRKMVEEATLEKIPQTQTRQLELPIEPVEKKAETKKEEKKTETKVETKAEAKAEAKAETKVETKSEVKEEKKTKKSSGIAYDRSSDLHKKLIAEFLDAGYPGWKTTLLQQAKDTSIALEGTSFLDNEGLILQSFKDAFNKKMSK